MANNFQSELSKLASTLGGMLTMPDADMQFVQQMLGAVQQESQKLVQAQQQQAQQLQQAQMQNANTGTSGQPMGQQMPPQQMQDPSQGMGQQMPPQQMPPQQMLPQQMPQGMEAQGQQPSLSGQPGNAGVRPMPDIPPVDELRRMLSSRNSN